MKIFIICSLNILMLYNCEMNTAAIPNSSDFSRMNISYSRVGGWINRTKLIIDSTGYVEASLYAHATDSLMFKASRFLSHKEREEFESLFLEFSKFDSYYEPDPWYTDGEIHTIIFHFNSEHDTVAVYEPENAEIPNKLNLIIKNCMIFGIH